MEKKKRFPGLILQWLLTPSVPIEDAVLLRKMKLLASMLLAFIGGSVLYTFLHLTLEEGTAGNFFWINGTNVFLAIGFWLNRRGHYRWAAFLTVVFLSTSILASTMLNPGNIRYLFVMIMPVLLGSMLFPLRGILLLGASILAGMVVLPVLIPHITFAAVIVPMAFFSTLTGLLLMFIHYRDRLEALRQEELAKKEAQYRSLVENINEVIYTADRDGRFTYISPVVEQITKFKVKEFIGRHFSTFIFPGDLPLVEANFRNVLNGTSEIYEFRVVDKNNQILYIRTYAQLLMENHQPVGIIGVFTDITEHQQLQDQLHQAQKMESVGRLAGGVAHDFNNLLTVIIGYCQMLSDDTKDNPAATSMVTGIHRAAERATSLTQQLLAFSRKQIIQPKRLNINELIVNLEKMLRRLIGEHIVLTTRREAEPGIIKVDPAQLEQVLMNLAVNARDAMPRGGKLTIETSNIYLDDAYCRLHGEVVPGDYVMLSISDTGCGMDEKTEENIFEPFFTTKEPGKGTGLGLSTVYGIVKQSGGHIGFYSQLNKGTTFNIYFPLAVDAEAAEYKANEQKTMEPESVEGSESLLVVEDQDNLREMMVESLKLYGYSVNAAQNGAEALEICQQKQQSFDLLITDVVMPEMNGKELAEKIARQSPGIKTLYISGYAEDTIGDHNILLEGLFFLPKPFSPTALAQKVRYILDNR
ncbi:MAG: response regulator [Candidatus Aminicenantes bacterium]|jgi:PAS domain S-box-containing protein